MSSAKALALSYRRSRSLLRAFITIQSRSPLTKRPKRPGSIRRLAAAEGVVCEDSIRELGVGASSSRIIRSISSIAAFFRASLTIGVVPVNISYRITPSE